MYEPELCRYPWLLVVIYVNSWLLVVIYGCSWLLVVTDGLPDHQPHESGWGLRLDACYAFTLYLVVLPIFTLEEEEC